MATRPEFGKLLRRVSKVLKFAKMSIKIKDQRLNLKQLNKRLNLKDQLPPTQLKPGWSLLSGFALNKFKFVY